MPTQRFMTDQYSMLASLISSSAINSTPSQGGGDIGMLQKLLGTGGQQQPQQSQQQQQQLLTPAQKKGADKAIKTIEKNEEQQGQQFVQEAAGQGMSAEELKNHPSMLQPASTPISLGGVNKQGQVESPGFLPKLFSLLATGKNYDASETLKNLLATNDANKTKGVYGFDTVTGKVTQKAEVPANADIRNMATGGNSADLLASLPSEQQLPAAALAKKFGVRNYDKIIPTIVNRLKEGKNIDQIDDEIRMSQQSIGVTGEWRNAAQSILGTKVSESQRNVVLDALDDYRQSGDDVGAKEYLKNIARESAPVDQQNRVMGKERTVELLDEIQGDVDALEKSGIGTGFLRGNIDGIMNRIGRTVKPEFREAATKIAIAVINYRNAMSGVAFGEKEAGEYRRIFPNKNNLNEVNTATITGLKKVFNGDTEKFYQQRMGSGNYNKLFGESRENNYGTRNDGTQKGTGYFGELSMQDGTRKRLKEGKSVFADKSNTIGRFVVEVQ